MALLRASLMLRLARPFNIAVTQTCAMSGEMGSGAGKGGGTGGTIRDAGGSFGKMESAHEEQYFRKLQALQLKQLKEHHDEEIDAHENEIRRHNEAIKRLKKKKSQIDDAGSDSD
ncbi:ATPase inhibitor A, mitochondrial-like [Anneissia japonica]|uniref:ATPase inhibitor A, mitochondrial-like n=1 Tax=Anneissia japonica TaxID=1529436 RepID=UPI0014259486|nr:ATPase inhibitor A, mitochondrial-like [Anneissia japonica]